MRRDNGRLVEIAITSRSPHEGSELAEHSLPDTAALWPLIRASLLSAGRQQTTGSKAHAAKNADTAALEKRLADTLGLAVSIDQRQRGGTLAIRYRSLDQLDEVVKRLERKS